MQSGKLVTSALGQNFHAAVMIVADPSGDPKQVRFALDEPAESDALHAPADDVATSLNGVRHGLVKITACANKLRSSGDWIGELATNTLLSRRTVIFARRRQG